MGGVQETVVHRGDWDAKPFSPAFPNILDLYNVLYR